LFHLLFSIFNSAHDSASSSSARARIVMLINAAYMPLLPRQDILMKRLRSQILVRESVLIQTFSYSPDH
jgi:hypothetical protein